MRKLLRKIRDCLRAFFHYRNFLNVSGKIIHEMPICHIELRSGVIFDAPKNSNVAILVEEIFFTQDYIKHFPICKNDLVVDIGANIGIFSVFAAKHTSNRVYAFEALPENSVFLEKNILNNHIKNVHAINSAVCGTDGVARLGITHLSGGHYLCDTNTIKDAKDSIEVTAITLPKIFSNFKISKINFLKMDCEGSEGAIFQTTPAEYFSRIDKIAMEYHDKLSLLSRHELVAFLKKHGFRNIRLRTFRDTGCGYIYAWR
jgi:FkbM family methyltransferase